MSSGLALAAAAEVLVYVPLGSAGEVLVIDAATDAVVGRIPEVPDSHGLGATPDGRFLIAGSFAETTPGESEIPPKPAGMSESEHQAHHRKPGAAIGKAPEAVSFLSIIRAQDGSIVRRIEVPGAVHHVAVTPDGRYAVQKAADLESARDQAVFQRDLQDGAHVRVGQVAKGRTARRARR